jgi:hypothetical protein
MASNLDGIPPEILQQLRQFLDSNRSGSGGYTSADDGPSDPYDRDFIESLSDLPKASSYPTPSEVREERSRRVKKIFEDWTLLNRILLRHEETINKRWLKKTREQRKSVLLTAWPNMSPYHRPEIEAYIREKPGIPTKSTEAYMWPHINQEDLLKPKLLLIFLNSRGRNYPAAFAAADIESNRFAFVACKVIPAFLNEYVMMFTGRNTPENYGELLSWDDLHTGRGLNPGEGLQVLEIQERIHEFLLSCCLQILHDKPPDSLMLDDSPIQPTPPALSTAEPGVDSLAALAAEAPYRLPEKLDLNRLQSLIAGKLSAAEDHLWSLREDPGYFADVVLDTKEHRQEILRDTRGQKHSLVRPYPSQRFWDRVLGNVVVDAYFSLAIWEDLNSQISHLQSLKLKYEPDLTHAEELPPDLLDTFLNLVFSLEQYVKGPIGMLKVVVPSSPPLREYFSRLPEDGDPNRIRVTSGGLFGRRKETARLKWLLEALWDDQQRHLAGLNLLMDEMERWVQSAGSAKLMISSRVAGTIADLALLSECQHQISLFHPWAASFENEAASQMTELQTGYAKRTKIMSDIDRTLKQFSFSDLGDPSDGKFFYPVDKRRTRENTEAMQRAEEHLDHLWEKLDSHFLKKMDMSQHAALQRLLSDRILQRTPSWAEPAVPTERQVEELCKPLSQLYFELEHRTEKTIDHGQTKGKKSKIKTRSKPVEAQPASDQPAATPQPSQIPDGQPVFKLDKRALKVFSTLFYKPSPHGQPGEVPWNDFLHAMRDTGFGIEKLYGSVWQFTPSKLDVERSIQFHEPHPNPKIPYRTARRFGRRLSRAYGWHGSMFIPDVE